MNTKYHTSGGCPSVRRLRPKLCRYMSEYMHTHKRNTYGRPSARRQQLSCGYLNELTYEV